MGSVEAGGAFSLLVKDRGDLVAELSEVRRFESEWEKAASIELRAREHLRHRRLRGPRPHQGRRAPRAARCDLRGLEAPTSEPGRSSLMIAGDAATVTELNARARSRPGGRGDCRRGGTMRSRTARRAGVGDEIVTRKNNRLLGVGKSWVKNGDRFVVSSTNPDGTMAVRRSSGGRRGGAARRLRRQPRRARLCHDRLSQPRSDNRYLAHARLSAHDPRGALRRRDTRA